MGIYQAYPFYKKNKVDNLEEEYFSVTQTIFVFTVVVSIIAILLFNKSITLVITFILFPFSVLIQEYNYYSLIENPNRRNTWAIYENIAEMIVLTFFILFIHKSIEGLLLLVIGKFAIAYICSIYIIHKPVYKSKLNLITTFRYIKYGFIPMLTVLCMTVNYSIDIIMLQGKVHMKDIGIYSLGINLAQYVWLIPDTLKDILLSRLTSGKKEDEVAMLIRINLTIVLMLIVSIIIIGKPVISLIYGKEFSESYQITVIVLCGIFSMVYYKVIYSYNVVCGRKMINLFYLLIAALLNVIGNYILIPKFGIYGAASVSVCSYSICGLLFLTHFLKNTNIKFNEVTFLTRKDIKKLYAVLK